MPQINSYVSARKQKRKKIRLYIFSAVAFFFVYLFFFAVIWFILRAPVFRAGKIIIQGNNEIPSTEIISLLQASIINRDDIAGGEHRWSRALLGFGNMLVWPDKLPASDLSIIPQLADISISKDYWSHTVTVLVAERQPFGIWCYDGTGVTIGSASERCYWFDQTGTIFERASDTQGNVIPVIHDYSQKVRGLNETVLDQPFLPNLTSIINVLHKTGLTIAAISLNDISLQELDVKTSNGPDIYFSLRFSADDDVSVIQSLMAKPTFAKLQYIDCRTENRVYYK